MPLRILSWKGAVQIMPFQKWGRKCHFLLRFCTRNWSETYMRGLKSQSYKQMSTWSRKESVGLGIRGYERPGFYSYWGSIFHWFFFCFHVVKPLLPILALSVILAHFEKNSSKRSNIVLLKQWGNQIPGVMWYALARRNAHIYDFFIHFVEYYKTYIEIENSYFLSCKSVALFL